MRFAVGDLVVDTQRFTVERDNEALGVQPQVFDVMSYLVLNRDRIVTKEELLDEVWGDRFVSESALSSRIKSARQLLGDDGARQEVIKTFHGRGFRWVADIRVIEADDPTAPTPGTDAGARNVRSHTTQPPGLHTATHGRDDVFRDVVAAFADHRLVTLVGSPGIGKTRAALAAVRLLAETRPDVAFVELHAASGRADILHLVARAVGLDVIVTGPTGVGTSDDDLEHRVLERLVAEDVLLILDNCEHVAGHVAAFLRHTLPTATSVSVLATSRRPLWVDGERLVSVRPLDQPADTSWAELSASPAGALFLERSGAAGATWSGTDAEASLIAEICRRLDGVPLAIELAAARTRWMPLERLIADLTDVSGDVNTGSQPLASSLQSSRALLDEPARAAFDALSIFAGSFSFDAALRVIGAVEPDADAIAVFEQLIDHSLVEVTDRTLGRYRMLIPVQQFAASFEPRTDVVTPVVLRFFADLVERTWPTDNSAPGAPWDALEADMGDMLRLVERAGSIDPAGCRRLVGSLGRWWWMSHLTQRCVGICEQLGEPDGDEPDASASYLWTWSMCESMLWKLPSERALTAHRLAIDTEQWSVAASALSLAVAGDQVWADLEQVDAVWEEIETLYRRAGDIAGEAWARVRVLGHAQAGAGRVDEAIESFRIAIDLYRQVGDEIGVATAAVRFAREAIFASTEPELAEEALALLPDLVEDPLEPMPSLPYDLRVEAVWYAGLLAEARGDVELGLRRHRAAVAISASHSPRAHLTNTLRVHLASALRRAGEVDESARCFDDALAAAVVIADERPSHPLWVFETVAGLLADVGRAEEAATLFGAGEAGRERVGSRRYTWDQIAFEHDVALIAGSEGVDAAWDRGRSLELRQAHELARTYCDALRRRA